MAVETSTTWRVGELAAETDLTVRTLHHYDHLGLLSPSLRTPGGHRCYADDDVARLHRIIALRSCGLSLEEVSTVLSGGEEGGLAQLLRRQLGVVDERLRQAVTLRSRLIGVLDVLDQTAEPSITEILRLIKETTNMSERLGDIPELNKQNGASLGRLLGSGTVGHAKEGSDGTMTATIRIPEDDLVYEPSVLMVPHGGDIELTFINDDKNTHCAVLPSNGDTQFIWLVNHAKGTAKLNLGGPGYYWFGSSTGNDEGRGLTGAIVVGGDTPPEAKLDRPAQPQV